MALIDPNGGPLLNAEERTGRPPEPVIPDPAPGLLLPAPQRKTYPGPSDEALMEVAAEVDAILRPPAPPKAKSYAHHLTTTDWFKLDVACIPLWSAFRRCGGIYLVGSALRKPDWRDVDIRAILFDEEYDRLFPRDTVDAHGENAQWKLICVSISHYLSAVTGLPIDFQIQRMTDCNKRYPHLEDHRRNAVGMFIHQYDMDLPISFPKKESEKVEAHD